jgi:anaerobic selenocysteine-containing dehydrogenase
MGVAPALRKAVFDNLEAALGVRLPATPGLDTMGCMRAAEGGAMKSVLCLGGNLYGSNPDSQFARRALSRLDLITYLSTTLNTGHAWGRACETLILPVLARDEEPQRTTQESMFNYVRLSDGGPVRLQGPRSEVDILASLARLVFGDSTPIDWKAMGDHCGIRRLIARVIPGYDRIGAMDRTRREFHVGGRTFRTPRFPTPSGKAQFKYQGPPALQDSGNQLRLMTVRSEGQFNTVVYEEEDVYRGQDSRDVILMNRTDIARLGLRVDQQVTVRSSVGVMAGIRVRAFDIRAGNALMYFPEANVLVPTTTDPASKTPAFKAVLVTVEAEIPGSLKRASTGEQSNGTARRPLAVIPG